MSAFKVHIHGNPMNPPIFFLHAFPFSSEMWKDQIQLFSEKFYCLAPDMPGFGDSSLPSHAFTFEYYVDSILNYINDTGVEKSVWCGLSMGGYLALRMYERAPNHCLGLILSNTKAGADGNEAKLKRWATYQALVQNRTEFVEAQWQALIGESSQQSESLRNRFEELIGKTADKGIISGLVAMATRTDSAPHLSQIDVPTLILVGEEDKITPIKESEAMAEAIAGSQLKILGETGHLSNLESPRLFNDALSVFLNSRINGHHRRD